MTGSQTLRRDIFSAYLASGARLTSWIVVTAIVYRQLGPAAFAILALVRTTIGLLNYTSLGLAPATVRFMAGEKTNMAGDPSEIYSSSAVLAAGSGVLAAILACVYATFFGSIHLLPPELKQVSLTPFVLAMGLGMALRLVSDPFGAALQVRGHITLDNLLLAGTELFWLAMCLLLLVEGWLETVGWAWFISGAALAMVRMRFAQSVMGPNALSIRAARGATVRRLLSFGLLVALAQAADFLYAPTDNILINRFVDPLAVATYAPAIQIDAGLLLLVGGLAATLLPHSASAHAQGDRATLRKFYVRGTLASTILLAAAAALIWLISRPLFELWLRDSMPATRAILPLVLIHTVVGGSSAVGRSILLAMGKVRPFTIAALTGGVANVILSFIFVRYCGLGLRGIVLGTIVAVVARCAIWTPWYVLKTLRDVKTD